MSRFDQAPVHPAALTVATTVPMLVATFQEAERDIREAFASIVAAEERLNAAFTLGGRSDIRISAGRAYSDDFENADRAIEAIARQAWGVIVERLELRRIMSIQRFAELENAIRRGPLPAITEDNVNAFVSQWVLTFEETFAQACKEVHDWLRPWRETYKTNDRYEVGPKVVLEHMVSHDWGKWHVRYDRDQRLSSFENVLHGLDGKGTVSKTHWSALHNAIAESPTGSGETDLFRFRCFKNGNLHLSSKRPDLIAKLNRAAGGANLKPSSEAA